MQGHASTPDQPRGKGARVAIAAGFCILAVLGNVAAIPLFFGVHLIFGSIAAMLALVLAGPLAGLAAAAAGGAYTVMLWGHPYALVIFVLEVAVVALLRTRLRHLALADGLFWLTVGMPLVVVFYSGVMNMTGTATGLIVFKQAVNGVLNALIAAILLLAGSAIMRRSARLTMSDLVFNTVLTSAFVPALFFAVVYNGNLKHDLEKDIAQQLSLSGQVAAGQLKQRSGAVDTLAAARDAGADLPSPFSVRYLGPDGNAAGSVPAAGNGMETRSLPAGVGVYLPSDAGVPEMQRWRRATYVKRVDAPSKDAVSAVLVQTPAAPLIDDLRSTLLQTLVLLALTAGAALAVARLISAAMTRELSGLVSVARTLPSAVADGEPIRMPGARIAEVDSLTASFRKMAESLQQSFQNVNRERAELEDRVAERTRELEASEANYRTLVDDHPELLVHQYLPDTTEIFVNPAIAAFFNTTTESMTGRRWIDALPPDEAASVRAHLESLTPEAPSAVHENRTVDGNGTPRWTRWLNHAFFDADDEVTHYQSIGIDISDRKAAEDEMAAARARAEQLTRAKSTFVATMSHEIRTPLNGVLGMLGLLNDTELTSEQRDYVETGKQAAQTLRQLIDDILDFSKIEAGQMALSPAAFDPAELITSTAQCLQGEARAKGLTLTALPGAHLPPAVEGDSGRVRQVLLNLTGNALKFTDSGSVTVSATVVHAEREHATLRFAVSDTGQGIPAEKQAALFEEFTMLEAGNARREGGTGLGLTISRKLVNLMGGDIAVSSAPGEGSTFHFDVSLPVRAKAELAADADTAEAAAPAAPDTALQVLVADDNATNRKLACGLLDKLGYGHTTATDGTEAVAAVRDGRVDAVLMDVSMPHTDGITATREIRALGAHGRHLPIIAMTAHAMDGDRDALLREGMDDYLRKPLDRTAMAKTLAAWLAPDADAAPRAEQNGGGAEETAETPVFDPDTLRTLWDSVGADIAADVVNEFTQDASQRRGVIQTAHGAADTTTVQHEAHALAGSAENVGAARLAQLARRVEEECRHGETAGALARVPDLDGAIEETLREAERLRLPS